MMPSRFPNPADPEMFGETLRLLGWSRVYLASLLGCNEKLVRRWDQGEAPVPPQVSAWLLNRMAVHYANPPPSDWRVLKLKAPAEA
jgi:hypothetical protein